MKKLLGLGRSRRFLLVLLALIAVFGLLTYKLGTLVPGLSQNELRASTNAVGWHGIYQHPLNLPLEIVRSIVFKLAPDHGALLTRLPNVLFGGLAIVSFSWLIYMWHGSRTAILTTLLFATSAWTLHVSRLASFDVLYLWAIPMLLIAQVLLHRFGDRAWAWYGSVLTWLILLYIPGMVWFVLLQLILQRRLLTKAWSLATSTRRKIISVLLSLTFIAPLIANLTRSGQLIGWLGLPAAWPELLILLKQLLAVPVHLFIRGPQYPELWLGKAPLLDVFSLITCGLGIYFYIAHAKANRSRTMGLMFGLGIVLVAIRGPVSLSVLVPLLYVGIATGIAYLLHDWFKVFPVNPIARRFGIGLVAICVAMSCVYNLRAYFVAWPYNPVTQAVFRYHR